MEALIIPVLLLVAATCVYGLWRIFQRPHEGVYIFLFLSAITITPSLPVIEDRLAIADFVMMGTIIAAIVHGRFFSPAAKFYHTADRAGVLLGGCFAFSSLVASMHSDLLTRVLLFMFIYLYGYCTFRVIIRLLDSPAKIKRAVLCYGAGALLVSLVGILASTGLYKPNWTYDPVIGRISSTFKKSGQVSSYLGPAFMIFIYYAASKKVGFKKNWIGICVAAMAVIVLIGTGSRMSFLITILLLGYTLWIVFTSSTREVVKTPAIALISAVVIGGSMYALYLWNDTMQSRTRFGNTNTSPFERAIRYAAQTEKAGHLEEYGVLHAYGGERYEEATTAIREAPSHLLVGVGSGLFTSKFQMNEVHNSYFSILIENGLPALIALVVMWFCILKALWRGGGRAHDAETRLMLRLAFAACLALLLYQMTTMGVRQRPFWFIPALALCVARLATVKPTEKLARKPHSHGQA